MEFSRICRQTTSHSVITPLTSRATSFVTLNVLVNSIWPGKRRASLFPRCSYGVIVIHVWHDVETYLHFLWINAVTKTSDFSLPLPSIYLIAVQYLYQPPHRHQMHLRQRSSCISITCVIYITPIGVSYTHRDRDPPLCSRRSLRNIRWARQPLFPWRQVYLPTCTIFTHFNHSPPPAPPDRLN